MRNAALVLLTLTVATAAAPAQVVVTDSSWAGKLFAEGTTHNFNSVPKGGQLLHRFKMVNIYAVPLEITNVRSPCNCITATPSTKVIQPRETAYLDVVMNTRLFSGLRTSNIYVTVGPQYVSTATLQVTAFSRTDVVLNPGEVNFGVVAQGQAPEQALDIEYAGVLDWKVTEVVPTDAPVKAQLRQMYRNQGQVGYRLTVALRPDAPPGTQKYELQLRTNDPASPTVPVLVEATVQASLTVLPSTVRFNAVKVGETLSQRVVLRGARPFRVVGADGARDGVSVELPATAQAIQAVTLRYQPTRPGELRQTILLRTDLDNEKPVTVTVEGSAEEKP